MRIRFELLLSKLGFEQRGRTLLRFALRDVNRREGHHRRDTSIQHFQPDVAVVFRQGFEQAVAEHRAERHARGFSCWGQFVAMLFCHLGRRSPCGRFAADWPPAKASCGTWGCPMRPSASPWPMPTSIGPGSCTAPCFINCWPLPRSFRSAWLPLQEPTAEPGRHPDRTLRQRLRLGVAGKPLETSHMQSSALLSKTLSY